MNLQRLLSTLTVTACSIAASPDLHAEVDVIVPVNARVLGSIAPEGEVETLRFEGVAGSTLSFALVSKKKAIDFDIALLGPDDEPIDLGGAKAFVDSGSKIVVRSFELTASGLHTLRISGIGTGDYALKMRQAPFKKKTFKSSDVASSGLVSLEVPVVPTALLTLTAKAAKGSAAQPRITLVEDADTSNDGVAKPSSHLLKLSAPITDGSVSFDVQNVSEFAGDIDVTVLQKAPKVKTSVVDVRGVTLGKPMGGETVVAAVIDSGAGGVLSVMDEDSDLFGAEVSLGSDALAADIVLSMQSSPDGSIPDAAADQHAGPTIAFGPTGTEFTSPVSVVLPFDPTALPYNASAGDIRVIHTREDGTTEELIPTSVDEGGETVTIDTTSFSSFTPIVEKGAPQLDGRNYWMFGTSLTLVPAEGDDEAWERSFDQIYGTASFGTLGSETFELTADELSLEVTLDELGNSTTTVTRSEVNESGTWQYLDGEQSVRLTGGDDECDVFVSDDGSILLLQAAGDVVDPSNDLELYIEKPDVPLTPAQLAGTYWIGEISFEPQSFGGPLSLAGGSSFGTATWKADGTLKTSSFERFAEFDGTTFDADGEKDGDLSIFTVAEDGSVVISSDGDIEVLYPNADGSIMVGVAQDPFASPDEVEGSFIVLVRRGNKAKSTLLNGAYPVVGLEYEFEEDVFAEFTTVPDFDTFNLDTVATFEGSTTIASSTSTERAIFRDPSANGGVRIDSNPEPFMPTTFKLDSKARMRMTNADDDTFIGAVHSSGSFGFFVHDVSQGDPLYGMFLFMRMPPTSIE